MKRDLEQVTETTADHVEEPSQSVEQMDRSKATDTHDQSDSEEDIGPTLPPAAEETSAEAPSRKRRKLVLNAKKFYDDLPQLERYARSFMHRDTVISTTVTGSTNFVITASSDGVVKFWKKMPSGIEFVKQYRAHVGAITAAVTNSDGTLYASACATEKTIKAFDVVNFDLFTMLQLDYTPGALCWVQKRGQAQPLLAVSDAESPAIRIYDLRGDAEPVLQTSTIHAVHVRHMSYNWKYNTVISCDESGHVEYWTPEEEFKKSESVFTSKATTDLYEFRKFKSVPTCLTISPDCETFATFSFPDREVRIFKFRTGKLTRKYDESLSTIESMHNAGTSIVQLDDIEFGKRLGVERDLERQLQQQPSMANCNVLFDESGLFLFYATMLGIKVVNTNSNACVKVYGREEKGSLRPLHLSLYQGAPQKQKLTTLAMAASDNPLLSEAAQRDPILFCTAYRSARFYLFTSTALGDSQVERDAMNERPNQSAVEETETERPVVTAAGATLHTTVGDIKITFLDPARTPRTVENFITHGRSGYYDGTIFHRTIRQFMIQGGDPLGTGTGGESIWGAPFEDELVPTWRHEKYSLAMANSGPNSNGSQFFITTADARHLDGKHTVFGRVRAGFDVVHHIEGASVGKLDRPREPVSIQSVSFF